MKIISLEVKNFRNSPYRLIEFTDGVNVLHGDNGAGKTNLLEAIYWFALGKSFRGFKENDLIAFKEDFAEIKLVFAGKYGEQTLEAQIFRNKKRRLIKNGFEVSKLSEYLGFFRGVIFTPDHLNLIKGTPEFRRRFLDMAICQSFPKYIGALSDYNKILNQKNALFKSGTVNRTLTEVYNERLAFYGAYITQNRRAFARKAGEYAAVVYDKMTNGSERFSLTYQTQVEGENRDELYVGYQRIYEEKKETETAKKITLYGAHRDDFTVNINEKNARIYASQGQKRSAVLALKLAEGGLSKQYTGEDCVYLLDDILSELDEKRKNFILSELSGKQYIITGCESIPDESCNIIEIIRVI